MEFGEAILRFFSTRDTVGHLSQTEKGVSNGSVFS